jgi:pimeloyl-ACP methyl ester carboxylesterase
VAELGKQDAPAVLCLHGWPQNWLMWRRVVPLLEDGFRLICPDLRGFGWSGWPEDGDFRKQRLADDSLAVLDALGLEKVHVIGHDWGAWTGLLLATGNPERLHTLLAIGIVHPWQPTGRALANAWRAGYQIPLSAPVIGERLLRRPEFIRYILRSGWSDHSTWDEEAAVGFAEAICEPQGARAGNRLYRSFLTRELPASAAGGLGGRRLGVPTRLVIGGKDPLGAHLAAGIERHGDDAAWEILEGIGHFAPEEAPQAVATRARSLFLAPDATHAG